MSECPYCGVTAADAWEEKAHMEAAHPEVIEKRLIDGGFRREADGTITDLLSDPND